ncbi:MAG: hypothetical protein M0006_04740 [Magnetospirillum sp.]|nr:hypothetical protein [Magnetospirillum sp.]
MSNILTPGQQLLPGQAISSTNNGYELILQNDGNLVLYRTIDMKPLWATGTDGKAIQRAIMQGDGNFVLYFYNGSPAWASGTNGKPGSYLIMQDDGNAVIYWPNDPLWATNTVQ